MIPEVIPIDNIIISIIFDRLQSAFACAFTPLKPHCGPVKDIVLWSFITDKDIRVLTTQAN